MALRKLSSLGSYELINGGAHRKAGSIVGIPALVRHLAFWNTGFPAAPREGEEAGAAGAATVTGLAPKDRVAAYDLYIANLSEVLLADVGGRVHLGSAVEPADEFVKRLGESSVQSGTVTLVRFWWHGIRATVRVEFHTEFTTVTSILDLAVRTHPEYRAKPGTVDVQARIRKGYAVFERLFSNPDPSGQHHATLRQLQDRVWSLFEDQILNGSLRGERILEDRFGEVFADLRGVINGSPQEKAADNRAKGAGAKKDAKKDAKKEGPLQPLFELPLPRRRNRDMRHSAAGDDWHRDTLKRVWPLLEFDPRLRDFEFCASAFLEGRVLYVSALGPDLPRGQQGENRRGSERRGAQWGWTPVYYYLHAYIDDEWQIGRLVDRLHTAGTLRLAAIMQIDSLSRAGEKVETVAERIEQVALTLREAIKDAKSKPPADADESAASDAAATRGQSALERADPEMSALRTEVAEIDNEVSGDILYRLERSHYYVEQFKKACAGLREKRIEGFQLYCEFVMRRMDGLFGYLDVLRLRVKSIEAEMSSLDRQYSSLKITSVTCSIDGLVTKMTRQDEEIAKIQEFGEIALIGVLVPYYLSYSLSHVTGLEGAPEHILWLTVIGLCTGAVLYRIDRQSEKDPNAEKRLRPYARLFAGYFLIVLIAATLFHTRLGRDLAHEAESRLAAGSALAKKSD
ncbi:MAG TPA: hypothetical protein VFZ91_09345 [Allosphingosinicella sp.]